MRIKNRMKINKLGFGLIIIAVLLSACTSSPKQEKPTETTKPTQTLTVPTSSVMSEGDNQNYAKALENLQQGEVEKARKALNKLAKKYGGHFGTRLNLAIALFQEKKLDSALEEARYALAIKKDAPEALNIMGLVYVEKKQFKDAQTQYLKAISKNKNYAEAYYNLALLNDIYFQDIPRAYQYYTQYLNLNPEDTATKDWVDQLKYSLESE